MAPEQGLTVPLLSGVAAVVQVIGIPLVGRAGGKAEAFSRSLGAQERECLDWTDRQECL